MHYKKTLEHMKLTGKLTIVGLISILISCSPGYKKENGKWAWISYDEGAGKRVKYIDNIDIGTFRILGNKDYALDKYNVYNGPHVIPHADPKTFEVINDRGYSKDSKNVFLDLDIVINANPKDFEVMDWPYSKDNRYVFCGNLPIDLVEISDFKVLKSGGGKNTSLKSSFIEFNPEYKWLDTVIVDGIITGEGLGETKDYKFDGYKKIKK
jgi:hypothetical protein